MQRQKYAKITVIAGLAGIVAVGADYLIGSDLVPRFILYVGLLLMTGGLYVATAAKPQEEL